MLFARGGQLRRLTCLKKVDRWNVVECLGFRTGTLVGLEHQMYSELLNKGSPENEHWYDSNWAATSKGREIELLCEDIRSKIRIHC